MVLQADILPLSSERWLDLERLFGPKGACGGCWCMYWLLGNQAFGAGKGEGNRSALHDLAGNEPAMGLLAYVGGEPVAWSACGPRERYPRLERSRVLKRVDDQPVWSIVCFFTAKRFRRQGISVQLINATCAYAAANGAHIVEGYPVDTEPGQKQPDPFVYTGIASAVLKAGFREVARRSPTRPIMRCELTH